MSKCMTIDETIDQKDTFSGVIPKDIVDSVLEEILVSVLTVSDKGCNRIGDFNINEDFSQQYNQPLHVKDFEQGNINETSSANLFSDKNKECSDENSKAEWLGKTEEKVRPGVECKVISEEILAENELQIQNGHIYLEKIKSSMDSSTREEYFKKEDVIKDEKIEIEYYNQGKMNKIYVPLNEPSKDLNLQPEKDTKEENDNKKESEKENARDENESPFKPFITEDLRQIWNNGNSSLVGKWDGDVAGQREEVVKLMEGLSNIQVYPDISADPNRPRTCSVAEEDVKKMIKEIEEISFIQSHDSMEDYPPDGQGDADLESKSFTRSKDFLNKSKTESRLFPENSSDDIKRSQEEETFSTEIKQDNLSASVPFVIKEQPTVSMHRTEEMFPLSQGKEERSQQSQVLNGDDTLESNLLGEASAKNRLTTPGTSVLDTHLENAACMEDIKENIDFSVTGSVDILEYHERIFETKAETVNSTTISGNDIFSEFMVPSRTGTPQLTSYLDMGQSSSNPLVLKESEGRENTEIVESLPKEVIESLSEGRVKNISEDSVAENVQANGERPSGYKLTEVLSQCNDSCSQTNEPSSESISQSKGSISLHSQGSSTSSGNHSQNVELEKSDSGKIKLHSEKMYLRMGFDPAGFQKNKSVLSKSEEAFIESTESVLQIIEPEESNLDVASSSVSFTPLSRESQNFQKPSAPFEAEAQPNADESNDDLLSDEISPKKAYSGMTTIGPMKNVDYDPKDLTAPDIDFGKMTRITSSRQLAKDLSLLGADLISNPAIKILEEDDSDESIEASDNDCVETTSLINRDIASLTKVQKIREVMSYQPKPEDDFEDDEATPKTRLDLKDVESMTDKRYKGPEVGIPLLPFEVTAEGIGTDVEVEKQLIESMGLFISGLTDPYYKDLEENNDYNESSQLTESLSESPQEAERKKETKSVHGMEEINSKEDVDVCFERAEAVGQSESKYGTLSGVLKKASSKFMKKESDVLLRNSKSLPRDTSKIITTESIRSILDDCSSSASNVLKKSRSMLRNTQSLFKTISQNRMSNDLGLEKHKMSPSESDVSTVERKLSFLKKEDFSKAKNMIKNKMEKTFKRQESSSETDVGKQEMMEKKKELQMVIRNEEKLRVDKMENFKRWLPKSPLVYKSQFVKSQIRMKDKTPEPQPVGKEEDENDTSARSESINVPDEEAPTVTVEEIKNEVEVALQQEQNEEAVDIAIVKDPDMMNEKTQPDYIVMETVQGLPTSDPESPSSEKENVRNNVTFRECDIGSDHQMNKSEAQRVRDRDVEFAPEHTEVEDKVASKIPSERKMTAKKKKLTARFRNFWCSAFGRVKTSPKKSDVS